MCYRILGIMGLFNIEQILETYLFPLLEQHDRQNLCDSSSWCRQIAEKVSTPTNSSQQTRMATELSPVRRLKANYEEVCVAHPNSDFFCFKVGYTQCLAIAAET